MIKNFTLVLGIVLLGVGAVGMLSGGHDHELIIFGINTTHNLVHVVSGAAAIAAALAGLSKLFNTVFGLVYGLVAVAGFAGVDPVVTMLNLNAADNFLHAGIAAACLYFGVVAKS